MSESKQRIRHSKYLPDKYKETYKQDFEELLEEDHKKIDESISNKVTIIKDMNISITL